jgi:acyl-[acyl-carrier-protein]-phospholipid O-acyltransferase/long-chain-fatty-acid--[acyl-carrier-protein] ligase
MSAAPEAAAGPPPATAEFSAGRTPLARLTRDTSFIAMTTTQFLGAFNDNLFKQLVLLICLDVVLAGGHDWQGVAQATFAVPFVLFSGFAGWLSDRYSKRTIVVCAKVAEVVIMSAGMAAFFIGGLRPEALLILLLVVLGHMGIHSAFFGPAKYGILPELFAGRDLPAANGLIQMTTFLAIIFGTAIAGIGKEWLGPRVWIISAACVVMAVTGTATSLFIRRTPIAHPGLALRPSSLAIDSSLWETMLRDRKLLGVLLVSSLFWMIGGLVPLVVNAFGKLQLGLTDTRASVMTACIGFGIAAGCAVAARLCRGKVRFGVVTLGGWGIIACFLLTIAIGWLGAAPLPQEPAAQQNAPAPAAAPDNPAQWPSYLVMVALGLSAGLFAVPLQVFLQVRPPKELKGRMIGAMNLVNWIGIVMSAGVYAGLALLVRDSRQYALIFGAAALMLLPVALFYRPKDEVLDTAEPV